MRRTTDFIVIKEERGFSDALEIDKSHRRLGWLRVGYHYVINKRGDITKGRDIEHAGAHTRGFNDCSVGIALTGNGTEVQLDALHTLIVGLVCRYPTIEVMNPPTFGRVPDEFNAENWWKNILNLT